VPNAADVTGQDPLLAPLGNYGGPNFTIALLPGSVAINAGAVLAANDQRGLPTAPVGGNKDIGAFESQGFNVALVTPFNRSAVVGTNFTPLAVTVTPKMAGEPVLGGRVTFTANTAASGATATIAGNVATIVDVAGIATATTGTVTANNILGTYTVDVNTAGRFGVQPTQQFFTLTKPRC